LLLLLRERFNIEDAVAEKIALTHCTNSFGKPCRLDGMHSQKIIISVTVFKNFIWENMKMMMMS
jgi:hypothetical protein